MRIAAGILMIIGGVIGDIFWVGILKDLHIVYGNSLITMLPGFIAAWGGICTLRRKSWGWALSGAICSLLFPFFGIPAVILLVKRKSEFSHSKEWDSYDQA